MPYDPVKRHQIVETKVSREILGKAERKYYRWRIDRWYGGIVTADAVGCGLSCKFCWVSDRILYTPEKVGAFYGPTEAARRLFRLVNRSGLKQVRISGGEPTLGRAHLIELLDLFQGEGLQFILETNGILLGVDQSYARDLSKYDFLHARVSLKGCIEEEFISLTDAQPEGFTLQLRALENLINAGVSCHPSVITSFSSHHTLNLLKKRLRRIDLRAMKELENEELILYPKVAQRLRNHGLSPRACHAPNSVPPEQI